MTIKFRQLLNCPTLTADEPLSFTCPQNWDLLQATDSPDVRHCAACKQNVHLCRTAAEFVTHGEQGHCVAIPSDTRLIQLGGIRVGRVSPESVRAHRANQERVRELWQAVLDAKILDKAEMATVKTELERAAVE